MPGSTELPYGNVRNMFVLQTALTFTPTTVAGTTGSELTASVTGLQVNDFVDVSKPTQQSYIGIGNTRVSAAGVLAITFTNSSTGTVTPTASEVYTIQVVRPSIQAVQPTVIE
jgi:hypothetical protein